MLKLAMPQRSGAAHRSFSPLQHPPSITIPKLINGRYNLNMYKSSIHIRLVYDIALLTVLSFLDPILNMLGENCHESDYEGDGIEVVIC